MSGYERAPGTYQSVSSLAVAQDDSRVNDGMTRLFGQQNRPPPAVAGENFNRDMLVGSDEFDRRMFRGARTIIIGTGRSMKALTTVVAPVEWSNETKWEFEVYKINVSAALRNPHRAPTTENSLKARVIKGSTYRISKGWTDEVDHINTEFGRRLHAAMIQAMLMSVQRTFELSTIEAVYTANKQEQEAFENFKTINVPVDKMIEREILAFASLSKGWEGFVDEYARHADSIEAKGGTPNAIILSTHVVRHMDRTPPQETEYVALVDNGNGNFSMQIRIGPKLPLTFNGTLPIVQIGQYEPEDDDIPVDFTVRPRSFSIYHPMLWKPARGSSRTALHEWHQYYRDISIYDGDVQKTQVPYSLKNQAFPNAMLFDADGEPMCRHLLEPLGKDPYNQKRVDADDGSKHSTPARWFMTCRMPDGSLDYVRTFAQFELNKMPLDAMRSCAQLMSAKLRALNTKFHMDSMYEKAMEFMSRLESVGYDPNFFLAVLNVNLPKHVIGGRYNFAVASQKALQNWGNLVAIAEIQPNAFGFVDLPHKSVWNGGELPPACNNYYAVKYLSERAMQCGYGRDVQDAARNVVEFVRILARAIRAAMPRAHCIDTDNEKPYFLRPQAEAVLFHSIVYKSPDPVFLPNPVNSTQAARSGVDKLPDTIVYDPQVNSAFLGDLGLYVDGAGNLRIGDPNGVNVNLGLEVRVASPIDATAARSLYQAVGDLDDRVFRESIAPESQADPILGLGDPSAANRQWLITRGDLRRVISLAYGFARRKGGDVKIGNAFFNWIVTDLSKRLYIEKWEEMVREGTVPEDAVPGSGGPSHTAIVASARTQFDHSLEALEKGIREDDSVDKQLLKQLLTQYNKWAKDTGAQNRPVGPYLQTKFSVDDSNVIAVTLPPLPPDMTRVIVAFRSFISAVQQRPPGGQLARTFAEYEALFAPGAPSAEEPYRASVRAAFGELSAALAELQAGTDNTPRPARLPGSLPASATPGTAMRIELVPSQLGAYQWLRTPLTMSIALLESMLRHGSPLIALPADPRNFSVPLDPSIDHSGAGGYQELFGDKFNYATVDAMKNNPKIRHALEMPHAERLSYHSPSELVARDHEVLRRLAGVPEPLGRGAEDSSRDLDMEDIGRGDSEPTPANPFADIFGATSSHMQMPRGAVLTEEERRRHQDQLDALADSEYRASMAPRHQDHHYGTYRPRAWTLQEWRDASSHRNGRNLDRRRPTEVLPTFRRSLDDGFNSLMSLSLDTAIQRMKYANEESDPFDRIFQMALYTARNNEETWTHMLREDVNLPFNVIVLRPRVQMMMEQAAFGQYGPRTIVNKAGYSNYMEGNTSKVKEVSGNLTMRHGVAVYQPDMMGIIPDIMPRSYDGGLSMRHFKNPLVLKKSGDDPEIAIRDGRQRPGVLPMVVPITDEIPIHFDFSGRPKIKIPVASPDIEDPNEKVISSLRYYDILYEFAKSRAQDEQNSTNIYFDKNNKLNTFTSRCHYQEYSMEQGNLSVVHFSKSFMGKNGSGPTSYLTWNGDHKMFEEQNYHQLNIPPEVK